ncbi:hypothetical protein [uncultured Draconibacterium sp.]|uniref:hypothetical protein n=1 Tax=uncultured Draconibacterium sp. TaxID=1573823 RepID=UPI003216234A
MRAIYTFLIGLFLSLTTISFSQIFNLEWEKNSNTGGLDFYSDVIQDSNNGYTVVGAKMVKSRSLDIWILRFNTDGDTIWTKTLGTANKDIPKNIIQLTDKNYIVTASAQKENQELLFLTKLDESGTTVWQQFVETSEYLSANDIVQLNEESFALIGAKGTNPENTKQWMAAFNQSGEMIWEKVFNEDLNGCLKSIKKLPDEGFAMAGNIGEPGKNDCDICVLRTNNKGDLLWSSRVKSPGIKMWPECICCSPDSCFMVVGWQGNCLNDINSADPVFDYDMVLNKVDCEGKILWTKKFDREGSEGGNALTIRPNGNFIVAGIKATSFLGKIGPWLLYVDANGNELGEKLLPFNFNNDQITKVINCSDGGFLVIGPGIQDATNTRSNGWIMKFAEL